MATQKRLNKNLIAFLTVMAMILLVSVFAMVIFQQSRRDPKVLAEAAQKAEAAGDLAEALRRYVGANDASRARGEPETKYAIDAARCLFSMGEIVNWRGLLVKEMAAATPPRDAELRHVFLNGIWQVHDIAGTTSFAQDLRDTSRKLTDSDPNDVLALASTALALWALHGDEDRDTADAAAKKAFELDPTQPRAALAYVMLLQRQHREEFDQARQGGARRTQLDVVARDFAKQVQQIFEPVVAAHPDDVATVITFAGVLQDEAGLLTSNEAVTAGDAATSQRAADAATELYARVGQVLTTALDNSSAQGASADLHWSMARFLYGQLLRDKDKAPLLNQLLTNPEAVAADDRKDVQDRLKEIQAQADQATKLEPALYDAYVLQADLQQYETGDGGTPLTAPQRIEKMLNVLNTARERTLTLRSLRAQLRMEERLLMLRHAFDLSLAWLLDPNQADKKAENLARAEVFLKDAQVKYPEHPLTHFMEGQCFIAREQMSAAIGAFQQAYDRVEQLRVNQGRLWRSLGVNRLPSEQLALLYRQQGQSGEAERYALLALTEYRNAGARPSVPLLVNAAELLAQNDKPQPALDLLDTYRTEYADSRELAAVRAAVLTRLHPAEGKQAIQDIQGTDPTTKLWRSRWLADQNDNAGAEALLRTVVVDETATDRQVRDAFQQLMAVMSDAGRRAEARAYVQDLLKSPPRPTLARTLKLYDVDLAVENPDNLSPEQRQAWEAQRLAIIAENPDPQARAAEYVAYYLGHRDWEHALENVQQLRKLQPNAMEYAEQQFRLQLALGKFSDAEKLAGELAQYGDGRGFDRVGGAVYRGELALAQGDAENAIRELRKAISVLPKSDDLQIRLARAYLLGGRMAEALAALQQAVESNPRSFMAYLLLRQIYKQRAAETYGAEREQFEAQVRTCQAKAIELNPRDPQVKAWKQEQDEETNPLAAIAVREATRTRDPNDADNLKRLGELYVRAWKKAVDSNDDAAKAKVLSGAGPFFQAAGQTAGADALDVLDSAAELYAQAGQIEPGEALLRGQVERTTGPEKIRAQLLVAQFFQLAGNQDATEREIQQAQRLIPQVAPDPAQRRDLERRVGLALVGFYESQRRADKIVETCRWLLDRFGAVDKLDTRAQDVRLLLLQALFSTRQLDDAKTEVEAYIRDYPDDTRGLATRAQLSLMRGNRQEAADDLAKILERDPENVWAYFARGRLALEQGRYDAARADLTQAKSKISKNPGLEPDVHRYLANLYERTKEFELAESELRALLALVDKPGSNTSDQRQQVVEQLVRLLYGSLKQFDRAQRLISEYLERYPDDARWPFELGQLFKSRAEAQKRLDDPRRETDPQKSSQDARRDYDQAATYFQRACERLADKNTLALVLPTIERMNALTKAGKPEEAINAGAAFPFLKLPPNTPDEVGAEIRARLSTEVAKAFTALNQPDQATQQWQAALHDAALRTCEVAASVVDDLQISTRKQPGQAETIIRAVIDQTPADTLPGQRLRLVLATYLNDSGRAAQALPLLTDVLGHVPPNSPEHQAALLAQGITLQASGDLAGSIKAYRDVLAEAPDHVTALNNLAYLLVDCKEPLYAPAEALKLAERLRSRMTADDRGSSALDTIGWVYYKNGKNDLAAAALEEAVSLSNPNASMYAHLGEIYQASGRVAEARAAWTQALDMSRRANRPPEEIHQIEEALNKLR